MKRIVLLIAISALYAATAWPAKGEVTFAYFKQSSTPFCLYSPQPGLGPCPGQTPVYGLMIQGRTDSDTAVYVRYTVEWTDGESLLTTVQTVKVQRPYPGCWVDNAPCNAFAMWFFSPRPDFEVQSIKAEEIMPTPALLRKPRPGGLYRQ